MMRWAGTHPIRLPRLRDLAVCGALGIALSGAWTVSPSPVTAQTITGTLMDLESDRPIDLGLVMMFTEAGDSVALTVTDERGRFRLTSPEPGSFILLASALGYEETPAGVFELGEGGSMDVEYRIPPEPLALEGMVVSLDRPVLEHHLVQNGFVRRAQRGLGAFITPHDIENSPARSTEDLLTTVPGVRVGNVTVLRDSVLTQRPDIGQTVQLRSPLGGGWCTPTIYVDGMRSFYDVDPTGVTSTVTLSTLAPLSTVEAVEVYRRPAEIPVEYGFGTSGISRQEEASGTDANCGVLVLWTRSGLAVGQAPSGGGTPRPGRASEALATLGGLPAAEETGKPPTPGESIRLDLRSEVAARLGLPSPWEGRFLARRDGDLVASDERRGAPVAVPLEGVEALQVLRKRGTGHAITRGAIAGTAVGLGMWQFLKILCGGREGCSGVVGSTWFPAAVTGVGVGFLVGSQGPGSHWVWAPLPPPSTQDPGGAGTDSDPRTPVRRW